MTIKELQDGLTRAVESGLSPDATVLVESEPGEFDGVLDAFTDGDDFVISTDR